MSSILLTQVQQYVRAQFTTAEINGVNLYGGEFTASEVGKVSYTCPAIFLAVLGWHPEPNGARLTGKYTRKVYLAAFIAFKSTDRVARMTGAMNLADKLAMLMRRWAPDSSALPIAIAPLEEDATCENVYGRAIDQVGQALWLVKWDQCIKPTVPIEQLYDLIEVDITDLTRPGVVPPADLDTPTPLIVAEDVQFPPLDPS